MTVTVRVRPLLSHEAQYSITPTVAQLDSTSVIIQDDFDFEESSSPLQRHRRSSQSARVFTFDTVFGPNSDQRGVFEATAFPLIESVLDGINACVFASGATGSGKTYTMLGEEEVPGIMTLSLAELFSRIGNNPDVHVKCSFVEIYNEVVRDLLRDYHAPPLAGPLEVRDDPGTGLTYIHGVTEYVDIRDMSDMMYLLRLGNSRRTTEPTAANETSSRSHAVLQVMVEQHLASGETVLSKLSLVDLAGSERAKDTQNRGLRFIEGGNINRSLLALGNVIKALASKDPNVFVPYRDSKLTRLLKDSLGGNCRTVLIANVSPYVYNYTDALNTLKFANRAKNIKVKVRRNAFFDNSANEIKKYVSIIHELEGVVSGLRQQLRNQGSELKHEQHLMYTDESGSSGDESVDEEWVLKSQLMDTISEQLRIRNELARIDSQMHNNPHYDGSLAEEKETLMNTLQLNTDRSALLHRSMSNLSKRRKSMTPMTTESSQSKFFLEECCAIVRRILGPESAFSSRGLERQPSLLRSKSLRALYSPEPVDSDLTFEEKLTRLRDDLLAMERLKSPHQSCVLAKPDSLHLPPAQASGVRAHTERATPVVESAAGAAVWKALTARQPLRAQNEQPIRVSLQPHRKSSSGHSSGTSGSSVIHFN